MKIVYSIVFCIVLFCSGCKDEKFYLITLQNKSEEKIAYYIAHGDSLLTFPELESPSTVSEFLPLLPSKNIYIGNTKSWEEKFKTMPDSTLSIYFYKKGMLMATNDSFEDMLKDSLLNRYDLYIKDLQTLEFVVPYPPTSQMKDSMRIYPEE
jgi:hypothetical protein